MQGRLSFPLRVYNLDRPGDKNTTGLIQGVFPLQRSAAWLRAALHILTGYGDLETEEYPSKQ